MAVARVAPAGAAHTHDLRRSPRRRRLLRLDCGFGATRRCALDHSTDFAAVIRTGTDGRNNMPPFGAALTAEQIRAVSAYIVDDLFE